jgi:HEAT repeat protein
VRAVLARRLRTLAVADVLEQAEVLLGEDAAGVVQILGEVREPEITRFLLALAARADLPEAVRARAIGSIEADQAWERDELTKVAHGDGSAGGPDEIPALRAAAVQAMGAFATTAELIERIGDLAASPSAQIRGAVLWALQLAREGSEAAAKLVEPMLADGDPVVRRRAAYVAGNLGLDKLAPALAKRTQTTEDPALRLAAYVALGELGMPGVIGEVVGAIKREEDPRVLGAASNALIATALHLPPAHCEQLAPLVDTALAKVSADDPVFDALVRIKLASHAPAQAEKIDIDAEITSAFPAFAQLTKLAGFDTLVKSLRTAESLFHTANSPDADLSPPITLWM